MCTYLDKVGATYYFRRAVPAELRDFIRTSSCAPRTEWKISLRTKDRDAAKRLIPKFQTATQAELDAAMAQRPCLQEGVHVVFADLCYRMEMRGAVHDLVTRDRCEGTRH